MATVSILRLTSRRTNLYSIRKYVTGSTANSKQGLVLGVYTGEKDDDVVLTPAAKCFNDEVNGNLLKHINLAGPGLKKGKSYIFYGLSPKHSIVAAVGLGKCEQSYNELEELEEGKEAARVAAGVGCRALQNLKVETIAVENLGDAEAAAEGSTLSVWCFQDFKDEKKKQSHPKIQPFEGDSECWKVGTISADAQNFARKLSDTPSNFMTPTIFAETVKEQLTPLSVEVNIYDKEWAEEQKMGAFLSVSRGSMEPLKFVEMSYLNGPKDQKPIVFVGKGVTFDTGGISLKPPSKMDEMRADMGGAACVAATILAAAKLNLPINIIGLTPLCENMPSGLATKPGDIVRAMNGKTIKVDNTDAEGRLILADALCYASKFDPAFTLDIATLTGAMRVALGGAASGVFTNSKNLWQEIQKAGTLTGDRMWRFPLWQTYTDEMTDMKSCDINNLGKGVGGGSCTAAGFLREFAPKGDWMHLDIAGVMGPSDSPYLQKGMTGRPTRTLVKLISNLSKDSCDS